MQYRQRAWAEISLDALTHNVEAIRAKLADTTEYCAVVKADAYGHGEEIICRKLYDLGVRFYAVSSFEEAVRVRGYCPEGEILILGYKDFRRGVSAHSALTDSRMNEMYSELPEMLGRFKTVSFDNLAIKQLNAKRIMSEEEWNEFYMGDDGQFTMYIDLVKREFAKSSTSTERFKLTYDIKTMFDMVKR